MIAHVVLFQPRPDLSDFERDAFARAFARAVAEIPVVLRARVGRRVQLDRLYDQLNARNFSHVAIIEFAAQEDLLAYLDHPAHHELGQCFYETAESTLVYDFEVVEAAASKSVFGQSAELTD